MTEQFLKAMDFIFEHENVMSRGKVVAEFNPKDPGGVTKYGIDQRSHKDVDVPSLTKEQALEIYWKEWLESKADMFPWPLCLAYFDTAVNSGAHQAAKLLQRTVGAVDDGIIGPKTASAVASACVLGSAEKVALSLCEKKKSFYNAICKKNPDFLEFKNGWMNRVSDLKKAITT